VKWPGAGGDPSPSPSGLEDEKVLMGGSKVMQFLAPPLHRGGQGGQVKVTIFFFANQSCYSRGMEVVTPAVPRRQGPSGWAGAHVPQPRLSPHTGRVAAACSRSWVPGGRRGQGTCHGSRSLLLAVSGPGGRKYVVRGSQSPVARLAYLSVGDAI